MCRTGHYGFAARSIAAGSEAIPAFPTHERSCRHRRSVRIRANHGARCHPVEAEANSLLVTLSRLLRRPGSIKPFGSIAAAKNGADTASDSRFAAFGIYPHRLPQYWGNMWASASNSSVWCYGLVPVHVRADESRWENMHPVPPANSRQRRPGSLLQPEMTGLLSVGAHADCGGQGGGDPPLRSEGGTGAPRWQAEVLHRRPHTRPAATAHSRPDRLGQKSEPDASTLGCHRSRE